MVFEFSTKTTRLGKIWFLSYGPKTLDQSECRILLTAIFHKRVDFEGEIHRKQQMYSLISSECHQECLDMPNIISNTVSASAGE